MNHEGKGLFSFKEIRELQLCYQEYIFIKWLVSKGNDSQPTITGYPKVLKETIPNQLALVDGITTYKNLFECHDISYLQTLYKRLLQKGDLFKFNKENRSFPSPAIKKYIQFLQEDNNFDIEIENDSSNETNEPIHNEDEASKPIQNQTKVTITQYTFSSESMGKLDFPYKNLLLKGVPGTGKSRAIDNIIEKNLQLEKNSDNILRINIHSASSNSDLMQGIGISSNETGVIQYSEKQGLILDIIKRATFHPYQPFVLILEEIQENSLNELIGDLIYLIEEDKRAKLEANEKSYESYEMLVHELTESDKSIDYVKIPYLVDDSTNYKKMILPSNLYIFCTSNYRDDKKIIEDNLLRRFEVVELYPNKKVANEYAREFFASLNLSIIKTMQENHEIHPDRFMIGHASWKDVDSKPKFYRAFLKLITEFKDIREIEYEIFKEILEATKVPETILDVKTKNSYYELIKAIQEEIGYEFID